MTKPPRPIVLCILDGFGWRPETADNAVALANAPNWKRWFAEGPRSFLKTSGPAVGLPEGQMGNSEVGHMNIGSGRILIQDLDRINNAIADGSLAKSPVVRDLIASAKANKGALHLLGLLSPGGVHSHQDHIAAIAKIAAREGVTVWLHAFLDGRDTPPQSAKTYVAEFEKGIGGERLIRFGTVGGRFYGMDRDKRWERVVKAHDAIVLGEGPRFGSAAAAIDDAYATKVTDEFVVPAIIGSYEGMRDGDAVMMVNFRADRAREIMTALLDPQFDAFPRKRQVKFSAAAGMTQYSQQLAKLMVSIFPPVDVPNALGEVFAKHALKQLRIAETEKYAHVTFFFNGGREMVFEGEDRILVPSPKVRTYDLKPEMSAFEVTDELIKAIEGAAYDIIIVNYANADQVGHTGHLPAAIKAVESVDECLGQLYDALTNVGGLMLVTADHGNAEMMRDPATGEPHTAHTTLDVPLLLVNDEATGERLNLRNGRLSDLAPTILDLMALTPPKEMTGHSLLEREPQGRRNPRVD